jgi:phosphoribosylamine--glycine ligase
LMHGNLRVLVVGSGGREHAIAWRVRQDPQVEHVFVAPGNAGTDLEVGVSNVAIEADDIAGLLKFARDTHIGLTIVGPEVPLSLGIVDSFEQAGLKIFGPTRAAAELESSKAFCKAFLKEHAIPTAQHEVFNDLNSALAYVRREGAPIVIKADGLAAGKGVVVAMNLAEAEAALVDMFSGSLGSAGARVVVESFLRGEELSYIVVAAGEQFVPLSSAQDHKRVGDGDVGPNTGGMGAYSPAPILNFALEARIQAEVIAPTLRAMAARGTPFTGFLYAGLMIQADGAPMVLEFNTRLGDPETQPLMMRLTSSLSALLLSALDGSLPSAVLKWDARTALAVVMAAEGYPGAVRKHDIIHGLDQPMVEVKVFHAGTVRDGNCVRSSGGRVLAVCALGDSVQTAQSKAYAGVQQIHWQGCFYRRDIGWRAIQHGIQLGARS